MTQLLYIDLFCGAGGTSTGVARARLNGKKCAKVIACVNHDPNAIKSHAANHPDTLHFTEDIRTLDMRPLVAVTQKEREKYPGAKVVLWASLECTNFSKAKGGQPRDADSRTLAEHLFRYIEALKPDYIYIENVEEFMCWGDLDENGKPISKDKGKMYLRWVQNVCNYGYGFSHRLLNAADYGACTSRTRFFGIFARHGLPTVFPEPTHCKGGREADMFHSALQPWQPVRDVLELDNEGESIFGREKPLVERTLERIFAGMIKFVAGGKDAFLSRYNSVRPKDTAMSLDEPCGVITAGGNRFATVKVHFLSKQFSGDPDSKNISIDAPAGAITCKDHHALATAQFLLDYNYKDTARPVNQPAPTLLTHDKLAISNIMFIDAYYGNGHEHSINDPAPVLRCVGHLALVTGRFLDNQYGHGAASSIDAPSPTITNTPKQKLISVERGLLLTNPAQESKSDGKDAPTYTLVAHSDKTPPYLLITEKGEVAIIIYENDSPATRKIKEFMAIYGIVDIKMRMLNIPELKRIMGFGSDYTLVGTQTEQKKYIGNAVEVHMSQALCEALAAALNK